MLFGQALAHDTGHPAPLYHCAQAQLLDKASLEAQHGASWVDGMLNVVQVHGH